MKAVVTAAGVGSRSGLDGKFRKEMLPIYDCREGRMVIRPIIDCILQQLLNNGIDEVAVVLRPDDTLTRSYVLKEFPDTELIFQEKQNGYGHAVLMASQFVGNESFILNAGDGFLLKSDGFYDMVEKNRGLDLNILNIMKVANPQSYGCPVVSGKGENSVITGLEEKPRLPKSEYGLCAVYYLHNSVMKRLEATVGEQMELTPAIDDSIKDGIKTIANKIDRDHWLSVGKVEEYSEVVRKSLMYAEIMRC